MGSTTQESAPVSDVMPSGRFAAILVCEGAAFTWRTAGRLVQKSSLEGNLRTDVFPGRTCPRGKASIDCPRPWHRPPPRWWYRAHKARSDALQRVHDLDTGSLDRWCPTPKRHPHPFSGFPVHKAHNGAPCSLVLGTADGLTVRVPRLRIIPCLAPCAECTGLTAASRHMFVVVT